ncbi:hypothetical protein [Achromobacter phage Motura]|uniref:Uncharacterized protein n=1 Tax=Achromobacter phage Motura TaxID=2591403 RepID=A0A514CSG1_9CAUD|nr:hypothetical protein H1O15_gp059 [Achromobacter phage Motura]QDH83403.1 hypothetical protein [Achromobacter phage Motura]
MKHALNSLPHDLPGLIDFVNTYSAHHKVPVDLKHNGLDVTITVGGVQASLTLHQPKPYYTVTYKSAANT